MSKLKVSEKQVIVKDSAVSALSTAFEDCGAVKIGDYKYAIPVEVEGEIKYAKIDIVCGQLVDSKVTPAFDIDDAVAQYEADLEYKATVKASKEKAKADKEKAKASKASK